MSLIDLILNLAALLLWLNWRAVQMEAINRPGISILSNLKKTSRPPSRWIFLVSLILLLPVRAIFYWQLGAALNWIPKISFGPTSILSQFKIVSDKFLKIFSELQYFPPTLAFRADYFSRMLLYSFLSFAVTIGLFYFGLLLFSLVHYRTSENDPVRKLIQLHLGWIDRLPVVLKALLPLFATALCWIVLHPLLVRLNFLSSPKSNLQIIEQGLILGLNVYFAWKFFIIGLLMLYVLNSYIYLGTMPFWTFVHQTGRAFLRPIAGLPLQMGKIDLVPLVGMVMVFFLAEFGELALDLLYKKLLL